MISSMGRMIQCTVAAVFASVACQAPAQQADQVVPPAAISGAIAPVDEAFALYASSNSLAQVEGARLVLKSAQRSEVREFAQETLRVHTQALDELRRVATARGFKLPPAPTGRHADMVTKLSGVAATEREDAFVQRFGVDAHKETIGLYERHAKEGQDAALRKHAVSAVASLRERMAAAQKLVHAAGSAR